MSTKRPKLIEPTREPQRWLLSQEDTLKFKKDNDRIKNKMSKNQGVMYDSHILWEKLLTKYGIPLDMEVNVIQKGFGGIVFEEKIG